MRRSCQGDENLTWPATIALNEFEVFCRNLVA